MPTSWFTMLKQKLHACLLNSQSIREKLLTPLPPIFFISYTKTTFGAIGTLSTRQQGAKVLDGNLLSVTYTTRDRGFKGSKAGLPIPLELLSA